MPLQIQRAQIKPGDTTIFEFSDRITQRVVGFSGFTLSYGNTDHHVQIVSVSLSVNQSDSSLSVTANATMVDASGNNLDKNSSFVNVVALAWVGVDDPNLKLGNVAGISNGGSSSPVTIPGTDPNLLQAGLAGFYLSYSGTDHHMETACATVGSTLSGNAAIINGTAYMFDQSGNSASGTVDAGLLANCDPALRDFVRSTNSLQNSTQSITFSKPFSSYTPFLNGYKAQYRNNSDHHVKTFSVDLSVQSMSGADVTVTGAAKLADKSGNVQDDGVSHVSGFIIGI
ncbi:hypothetical protein GCT13_37830 [Paraburkholderia sp. CNPSo 3157]|uniref:Uncharacterized protein n=1 Tax=Paraburkholderia franconis TaxID=2654983 RepID=A0A7X1TKC4_9BURK|nr:hypothetical protein [Paraburkholderia franconis]MPW22436.1 hypothetical protein [Paraburkholderia franconis]